MSPEPERDPFNTAVAAELTRLVGDEDTGLARLARLTGIHRSSLRRYLSGERGIRISELRKIARALHANVGDIFAEAERSIEQGNE